MVEPKWHVYRCLCKSIQVWEFFQTKCWSKCGVLWRLGAAGRWVNALEKNKGLVAPHPSIDGALWVLWVTKWRIVRLGQSALQRHRHEKVKTRDTITQCSIESKRPPSSPCNGPLVYSICCWIVFNYISVPVCSLLIPSAHSALVITGGNQQ